MSANGIDEETGLINVYAECPKQGDSIMVTNCGDSFEVRYHTHDEPALYLTDSDIDQLTKGTVIWN